MGAHDGVLDEGELLAHLGSSLVVEGEAEDPREVVDGDHRVDALLDLVLEAVVGGIHVAERGVASDGGDLDGVEDRGSGGDLAPGDVGVPSVLEASDDGLLLEAHQLRLVGVRGDEGVDLEVAEPTGEGHVPLRGQRLIAEEDDFEVEQTATQLGHEGVGEVAGDVDARDDAADGGSKLLDLEAVVAKAGETLALLSEVRHRPDHRLGRSEPHALGGDAAQVVLHGKSSLGRRRRTAGLPCSVWSTSSEDQAKHCHGVCH